MACAVDLNRVRDGIEAISAEFRTATQVINSFLPSSLPRQQHCRTNLIFFVFLFRKLQILQTLTSMTGKR
jgi:hypothetical protein